MGERRKKRRREKGEERRIGGWREGGMKNEDGMG